MSSMSDEKIALRLAEKMGAVRPPKGSSPPGLYIGVDDIAYLDGIRVYLDGDFAWRVIEWMESQGRRLYIASLTQNRRMVWFTGPPRAQWVECEGNITPRHVCLAALRAL